LNYDLTPPVFKPNIPLGVACLRGRSCCNMGVLGVPNVLFFLPHLRHISVFPRGYALMVSLTSLHPLEYLSRPPARPRVRLLENFGINPRPFSVPLPPSRDVVLPRQFPGLVQPSRLSPTTFAIMPHAILIACRRPVPISIFRARQIPVTDGACFCFAYCLCLILTSRFLFNTMDHGTHGPFPFLFSTRKNQKKVLLPPHGDELRSRLMDLLYVSSKNPSLCRPPFLHPTFLGGRFFRAAIPFKPPRFIGSSL